jgi:hypothetical protein
MTVAGAWKTTGFGELDGNEALFGVPSGKGR